MRRAPDILRRCVLARCQVVSVSSARVRRMAFVSYDLARECLHAPSTSTGEFLFTDVINVLRMLSGKVRGVSSNRHAQMIDTFWRHVLNHPGVLLETAHFNQYFMSLMQCGSISEQRIKNSICEMELRNCKPDNLTVTLLIGAHCRLGKLPDALRLYEEHPELQSDVNVLNEFLFGAILARDDVLLEKFTNVSLGKGRIQKIASLETSEAITKPLSSLRAIAMAQATAGTIELAAASIQNYAKSLEKFDEKFSITSGESSDVNNSVNELVYECAIAAVRSNLQNSHKELLKICELSRLVTGASGTRMLALNLAGFLAECQNVESTVDGCFDCAFALLEKCNFTYDHSVLPSFDPVSIFMENLLDSELTINEILEYCENIRFHRVAKSVSWSGLVSLSVQKVVAKWRHSEKIANNSQQKSTANESHLAPTCNCLIY